MVLGGEVGAGKSSLALAMSLRMAQAGISSAFFTAEMTVERGAGDCLDAHGVIEPRLVGEGLDHGRDATDPALVEVGHGVGTVEPHGRAVGELEERQCGVVGGDCVKSGLDDGLDRNDRLPHQEGETVDHVSSVHEPHASSLRTIKEPCGSSGDPKRLVPAIGGEDRGSDLTGRDQIARGNVRCEELLGMPGKELDPMGSRRRDHPITLLDGVSHRLLDEYVLACLGRCDADWLMQPVRKRQRHDVDVGILEDFAIVGHNRTRPL